jgi:hypothetical protein
MRIHKRAYLRGVLARTRALARTHTHTHATHTYTHTHTHTHTHTCTHTHAHTHARAHTHTHTPHTHTHTHTHTHPHIHTHNTMLNAHGLDSLAEGGALGSYTGFERDAPPGRVEYSSRDFCLRRTTKMTTTSSNRPITTPAMDNVEPPKVRPPPDDASVYVGEAVGAAVGEVGVLVGDGVGADVGIAEGALVGDAVGLAVGAVGEVVGAAVGDSVATHACALQAEHPEYRWKPGKHSQVKVFP